MKRWLLSVTMLLLLGCSKREEPARRTEPWLASPSASAAVASQTGPLRLQVLPESSFRFSLPARRAKPNGTVPLARGWLELDPRDLSRTKATLELDLTRLELAADSLPADAELDGASASEVGLRWLELGRDVPAERRRQHSRAVFELSALEDVGANLDLSAFKQVTQVTVVGSLLLHGFRAPVRTRVRLQALPADSGARRLSIRSLEPVVLSLVAHDIVARSAAGVSDSALTARLSDVVGKTARVEFEIVAEHVTGP